MTITVFPKTLEAELPALASPNANARLKDFATSKNPQAPLTFGLYKQEKGTPLEYTYEFEEYKMLISGDLQVKDNAGKVYSLKPGDVIGFGKGDKVVFSSESSGLAFYVAQR